MQGALGFTLAPPAAAPSAALLPGVSFPRPAAAASPHAAPAARIAPGLSSIIHRRVQHRRGLGLAFSTTRWQRAQAPHRAHPRLWILVEAPAASVEQGSSATSVTTAVDCGDSTRDEGTPALPAPVQPDSLGAEAGTGGVSSAKDAPDGAQAPSGRRRRAASGDEDLLEIHSAPSSGWATFEGLPFYVAPETRELLENAAALHLRRPDLVPYAEGLSWASPRILLRGQTGTERYAEKLVRSLAKRMRCPLVVFDARRAERALAERQYPPRGPAAAAAAAVAAPSPSPLPTSASPLASSSVSLVGSGLRPPSPPAGAVGWLPVTPAEVEAARLLKDRTDLSNAEKMDAILSARHAGVASISPPPPSPAPEAAPRTESVPEFGALKREIETTMAALRSASAEAEEEERSSKTRGGTRTFREGDRVLFVGALDSGLNSEWRTPGPTPKPGYIGTVVSVPEAREGFRDEVRVRFDVRFNNSSDDGADEDEDGGMAPVCAVRASDLRLASAEPPLVSILRPKPRPTPAAPSSATSLLLSEAPGAPPPRPLFASRSPSPGPAALDLRDWFDRALETAERMAVPPPDSKRRRPGCILFLPELERSGLGSSQRAAAHVAAALERVPSGIPLLVIASNTSLSASGIGALLGGPDSDGEDSADGWLGSMGLLRPDGPGARLSLARSSGASVLARRVEAILRGSAQSLSKSRIDAPSRPLGTSSVTEDLSRAFPSLVYITPPLHDPALMEKWERATERERGRATGQSNREAIARVLARTGACLDPRRPPDFPAFRLHELSAAAAERVAGYALAHHAATAAPPRRRPPPPPAIRPASIRWAFRMAGLAADAHAGPPAAADGQPPLSRAAAVLREGPKNEYEAALMSEVIPPHEINVRFDDIGALDGVKDSLRELVMLPLRRPELFRRGNLTRPTKGVLLFGPPGTGKTMLAKAVATEAGAAFLAVSHASINSKFFGESEKLVRALFSLASRMAPTVIFIDEVDSMMGRRGERDFESSRSVKNELMALWDGLRSRESERVLVLAATNRPFDLDEAVLRRFSRRFFVDLPDGANRAKILGVILAAEELAADVSLDAVARMTEGYSGSDLKNLCISAAYQPIRDFLRAEAAAAAEGSPAGEAGAPRRTSAESEGAGSRPTPPLRPICLDDFRKALLEVSASVSNEGGTLDQLRGWNETYGEGGSRARAGRRLGFHFPTEAEEAPGPPLSTEP